MQEVFFIIAKALTPLLTAALMALTRPLFARGIRKKSKAHEDLEFIAGFLSFDLARRNRMVVEQAFAAHFRHRFDFDEIEALLKFKNPTKAFGLLRGSRKTVELVGDGTFTFKDKYSEIGKRANWKKAYFFGYGVAAYAGILPALFWGEHIGQLGAVAVIVLCLWVTVLMSMAVSALEIGSAITIGESLIEEQSKKI